MNKKYLIMLAILCAFSYTVAKAEESTNTENTGVAVEVTTTSVDSAPVNVKLPPRPGEPTREIIKTRIENREKIKDLRQEEFSEIRKEKIENREEIKDMFEDRKEMTKEEREETRGEIKEKMEENREEMKAKREEAKKSIEEKRAELKNELHQKMQVRFDAMVNRFNTLISRIESRILKLEAEGKDVVNAKVLVSEAKTLVDEAKTKSSTIVIDAGTDEEARAANKTKVDEIKALMKSAQEKLVSAIKLLK